MKKLNFDELRDDIQEQLLEGAYEVLMVDTRWIYEIAEEGLKERGAVFNEKGEME